MIKSSSDKLMAQRFCAFILLVCQFAWAESLVIKDYKDGEILRYPAPLFQGTLSSKEAKTVKLVVKSSAGERTYNGVAHQGKFKVLGELTEGKNDIVISSGPASSRLTLQYKRQTNPHMIRAVYFIDESGDMKYDTPFKDDKYDYVGKFDTTLKIMQTFTADWMNVYGYGRKTFNLEMDEKGKVIVHVINVGNKEKLAGGGRGNLFGGLASRAGRALPKGPFVTIATVAFSKHIKGEGGATFYTALGGGGFALMGGACFYSWPSSIQEVQERFMLDMPIDKLNFHADDNGRYAVWATASGTIGNGLHEMGHAMKLPHTTDWRCIMKTGGGLFNRHFTFFDPPSRHNKTNNYFAEPKVQWTDVSACYLANSRNLALDEQSGWDRPNTIQAYMDHAKSEVVVTSAEGVTYVAVEPPGRATYFVRAEPGKEPPKEFRFKAQDLRERFHSTAIQFRVLDGIGHAQNIKLESLFSPPFITSWHMSPTVTKDWKNRKEFNKMSIQELKDIETRLKSAKLVEFSGEMVDMALAPEFTKNNMATTFAYRKLVTKTPMNMKVFYDFDDMGRIWVNGEQVAEKSKTAKTGKDKFSAEIKLKSGANSILIETCNNDKKWGFYFRLEDKTGTAYEISKDELRPMRNISETRLFFEGPYVKNWIIANETRPLPTKAKSLPQPDEAMIKSLQAENPSGKPLRLTSDFIDFSKINALDKSAPPSISYAVTTFESEKCEKINLVYKNSNFARIWLNGKLLTTSSAQQATRAIESPVSGMTKEGKNIVLVESAHPGGKAPWMFSLRLETSAKKSLAVLPDGQLHPYPELAVKL